MTSKFFLAMYPLILMCALAFENQSYYRHLLGASDSNCSKVLKFDSTNMLAGPNKLDLIGVKGISYSIGYSVIDAVKNLQASGNPDDACLIRLATVINKYGVAVAASAEGAQAAIRGTNINNINIQSCPGFGLCADIWDGAEKDVYPISTLTYIVVPTIIPLADCARMKIVYDYLYWILTDPNANTIAYSQGFATMPKKLATTAISTILNRMTCSDSTRIRDQPPPGTALHVAGSGSSLQNNLHQALLRSYTGAGISRITYDGSPGSGGGLCQLAVGRSSCWFNRSSGETIACLRSDQAGNCLVSSQPGQRTDFAGSEAILEMASATVQRQGQRMVPVFAAAIGLVYNLPVPSLALSRDAVNRIFLGQIPGWNDSVIAETNPGEALPGVQIIRLVRVEKSGTTQAFARALASFANTNNRWGTTSYWIHHPLAGSALPTWPDANYTVPLGVQPPCMLVRCVRSICSAGSYVDMISDSCTLCPTGTYADVRGQQTKCTPCAPGSYAASAGTALCTKCSESYYQDDVGKTACLACPSNTRRFLVNQDLSVGNKSMTIKTPSLGASATDCKCLPGFWLPQSLLNWNTSGDWLENSGKGELQDLTLGNTSDLGGLPCIPCPDGARCPGFSGSVQTIPTPLNGFWGNPKTPFQFDECREVNFCDADYRCGNGHEGRMCEEPDVGYFDVGKKWYFKCPGGINSIPAASLTLGLTIIVILIWLKIMNLAEGSVYDSFDVGVKFLHLIGFIAQYRLRWHPNLDPIVLILLIANLEIDFISPHCVWPAFNGFAQLFIQLLMPFLIVGISTILWVLKNQLFPPKYPLEKANNEPLLNKYKLRDGTIAVVDCKTYIIQKSIQVFGFMYQVLAYRAFSTFSCTTRPDESFLTAAPDITCGSKQHKIMMAISILYIAAVIIGLPLLAIWTLIEGRRRNILLEGYFVQKYGCLYEQFKIQYVWWEGIVIFRKLSISMILALVQLPMIQGALTVILIYISILLHLSNLPYFSNIQNVLEAICLFCALGFVVSGMIFYPSIISSSECVGTSIDPTFQITCFQALQIKQAVSSGLICLVSFTFLLTVIATGREIYERYLSGLTSREIESRRKWFGMQLREKRARRASSLITSLLKFKQSAYGGEIDHQMEETVNISLDVSNNCSKVDEIFSNRKRSTVRLLDAEALDDNDSQDTSDLDAGFPARVVHKNYDLQVDGRIRRGSSVDEGSNPLKLHLCHMLDGFYLSSWRTKLKDMEHWDQKFRERYKQDNISSELLGQEMAYVEMDYILPRCSCCLFSNLAPLSNSAVSSISRQLLLIFPALIDYMATVDSDSRNGFSFFLQDFIQSAGQKPVLFNKKMRDDVIADDYKSAVAHFLLEAAVSSSETDFQIFQDFFDAICNSCGLKKHIALNNRRASVFEGLSKVARLSVCVECGTQPLISGRSGFEKETTSTATLSASLVHTPRDEKLEHIGYLSESDVMKVSSTIQVEEASCDVIDNRISNGRVIHWKSAIPTKMDVGDKSSSTQDGTDTIGCMPHGIELGMIGNSDEPEKVVCCSKEDGLNHGHMFFTNSPDPTESNFNLNQYIQSHQHSGFLADPWICAAPLSPRVPNYPYF